MPIRSTSSTAGSIALGGAACGEGDDLVVVALHAQRAVRELGRERGIRSVEAGTADARRQQQVGVRLVVTHGLEHLECDEARGRDALVARRPGCGAPTSPVATARAGAAAVGPLIAPPCRRGPRHATSRPRTSPCVPPAARAPARAVPFRCPTSSRRPSSRSSPGASGSEPDAATSSSTFSRWSSRVVHAPGSGVTPRNRLRTTWAGAVKSSRASSMPSLGANVGSPCCGDAAAVPPAMASTTPASRSAPSIASSSSSRPAVASGAISSERVAYTSPASSSGTSRNTDAPVRASPAMSACCTGAAPRHAGSSEKCRLIQPWRGVESSGSRTRPPYATITPRSGSSARERAPSPHRRVAPPR